MALLSDLLTYNFRGDSGTVVLGTSTGTLIAGNWSAA